MQSFSMEYENSSRRALASSVHSVFGLGPQTSMEFGNIAVINRNKRVNYLNFAMVIVFYPLVDDRYHNRICRGSGRNHFLFQDLHTRYCK